MKKSNVTVLCTQSIKPVEYVELLQYLETTIGKREFSELYDGLGGCLQHKIYFSFFKSLPLSQH